MSFLAPLFLLGGLAIGLPVIYHLIRRTTRERTVFSSLMFLLPSPPRLSQRHRLEHLLLLILRCLALALLALGFARPFLRQAPLSDPTAARPKRVVVLLDASASMRRAGVWAAARERVDAVLRQAGPADQVAVLTFDQQVSVLLPFEQWNRPAPGDRVAFAQGRLDAVAPGWGGTHLGNAIITAAETLGETDGKTSPGPRQVVLVSDLQAGSRLDALQAYEWPKGVELVVAAVKAKNPTNAGVQLVAEAADSSRAADAAVRVRVTNSADSKREQFKLGWTRVAAPGEYVGTAIPAYVPPGQSRVFAVPVPKGLPAAEQVVLTGDDEDFDNTVHVIPPVQQRAQVLWIGADAPNDTRQPLFFLLRALADTPRLAVKVESRAPSASLLPDEIKSANLIFIADSIPPGAAAALREQATLGQTLVFVPQTAQSAPTLAALLGRDTVRLEEVRPANYAMFGEIDFQHPLFAPFADPRFSDFTKIHFWKYRKFDLAALPEGRVVAKFDSGDPALVEVPVGKGRIFLLAAGWHPDDSQLAVSSKFVPLMWALLEWGGGVVLAPSQHFVGDKVPLPPGEGARTLRLPTGATVPLAADAVVVDQTMQPGIYTVSGGPRPRRFAVNLDPNESRTAPLDLEELEHLGVPVASPQARVAAPTDEKRLLQGVEAENRQKLWRWFIAATLAVLLLESALAGWTARRSTMKAEEVPS